MKAQAEITNMMFDRFNGKTVIHIEIPGDHIDELEGLKGIPADFSISKHREKRTLNANSYYWELVGKIADHLKISKTRCHNLMLIRYGTFIRDESGNLWVVKVPNADQEKILEDEMLHLHPTSRTKKEDNGVEYHYYIVIKGSSFYDKSEMSKLIDGAVSEATLIGIETLTPDELEKLKALIKE